MGLYSYTNLKELYELLEKNRIAFVVADIQCNDIDEYINNCSITLQNSGLNINLMTKPKIYKASSKSFNIVLIFKNTIKTLETFQKTAFISWANEMGNVQSLRDYLIFNNKLKSVKFEYSDIINIFKNKYNIYMEFIDKDNNICTAKLKFIYTGDRITCIEIIFNNKYMSLKQPVDSIRHGFYDMIAITCRKVFKEHNLKPIYALIDTGRILNKLKVYQTSDTIEFAEQL